MDTATYAGRVLQSRIEHIDSLLERPANEAVVDEEGHIYPPTLRGLLQAERDALSACLEAFDRRLG